MSHEPFSLFLNGVYLIRVFLHDDTFAIVRRIPCELNVSCTSTTAESRAKIWYQYNAFKPPPGGLGSCPF